MNYIFLSAQLWNESPGVNRQSTTRHISGGRMEILVGIKTWLQCYIIVQGFLKSLREQKSPAASLSSEKTNQLSHNGKVNHGDD